MKAQLTRIGDCAQVLPGYSLKARAEHEPEGTYQVILARHLTEGAPYHYQPGHELRMSPERPMTKYLVHPGDVLFVSRGARNHAVPVTTLPDNSVASGTLYVLRPKRGTDPGYLAWCINQASTQAAISQVRTGAGTPIVQRSTFGNITIPLPALEQQQQIAHLAELMSAERLLRLRLQEQTENYHRLVGTELLNRMTS